MIAQRPGTGVTADPAAGRALAWTRRRPAGPGEVGTGALALHRRGRRGGLALCKRLLANEGAGHTAVIHSATRRWRASPGDAGQPRPGQRPGAHGCIGVGNGLTPSLTLGCGTFGGNSTTDNVTYTNLLNIKRLARPV